MTEENKDVGRKAVKDIANFLNTYDNDAVKIFIEGIMNVHPTGQQSIFRAFMIAVEEWSKKDICDGRTKATISISKAIMEAVGDLYIPIR